MGLVRDTEGMLTLIAIALQLAATKLSADQVVHLSPDQAWAVCLAGQVQPGVQVHIHDASVNWDWSDETATPPRRPTLGDRGDVVAAYQQLVSGGVDAHGLVSACTYTRRLTDVNDPCYDEGENVTLDEVATDDPQHVVRRSSVCYVRHPNPPDCTAPTISNGCMADCVATPDAPICRSSKPPAAAAAGARKQR